MLRTGGYFLSILLVITQFTGSVRCVCYFPVEFLGTYLIQSESAGALSFSEISFELDAIPPWGKCHIRRGNNVILKDSTAGEDCMRCLHLTLKAPNVIQIHTEGLGKCYTKEEAVRATCPDDRAVHERKFQEIMLYRKPDSAESSFCPLSGKFRFTYTAAGGQFRCDQTHSDLSNCPMANVLGVRFRQCNFPDMDVTFRCLGDWEGNGHGDRYLALMDTRGPDNVRFRCGMYRVDPLTGRVFVSLSADSSCHNQLRSSTDGYESLILTPFPEKSPPAAVLHSHCRFPEWSQGQWETSRVSRDILLYRDETALQRLSITCLSRTHPDKDTYIVFSSTHCGQESYNCLWLKRRNHNVLEFQIGQQPSPTFSDKLCHEMQFTQDTWTTQGRTKGSGSSSCPITGDYSGILPENPGLCAKVASDCNNPDLMFYTVSSCENRSHVFEEREYRCLGSWLDPETGVTFTYTQRRDMQGFQCFSGKVLEGGREAYIKEAGHSCIRGEDPLVYGMKITRHASCPDLSSPAPRFPTVAPPEDPFYSPVPNDPYWYQKEADIPRTPTRSTDSLPSFPPPEDEPVPSSSTLRQLYPGLLLLLLVLVSWRTAVLV